MKFHSRISNADYQEAQKLIRILRVPFHKLRTFFWWVISAVLILTSTALIFLLVDAKLRNATNVNTISLNLIYVLPGTLIILMLPIFRRFAATRIYKKSPTLKRNISVEFDESGYEAEDGMGARAAFTWDYYDRFLEGQRVFVLRNISQSFVIISKSNMTAEEVVKFRGLLTRCIVRR